MHLMVKMVAWPNTTPVNQDRRKLSFKAQGCFSKTSIFCMELQEWVSTNNYLLIFLSRDTFLSNAINIVT